MGTDTTNTRPKPAHLALVVPALNEEDAIAGTLRRCLKARDSVLAQTPLKTVSVVFVNDGCTDRTQEIVDQPEFSEVVKVNYGRNRGYGAAIKAGWQATEADLVGFIDGDGTCDPEFCVDLVNRLVVEEADVVLAGRLNPDTQMPFIRKLGNRIFAALLGVVSGQMNITDTASGFRIIRRDSLRLMSPLPDGLHFTPAMSCICLLDPRLKIEEVHGMLYKEREGRSKLSVIKDGFRFLWTIVFSACCYSPIKVMLALAVMALLSAGLVGTGITLWTGAAFVPLLMMLAAGLAAALLVGTGAVAHQLNYLLIGPRRTVGPVERLLQRLLDHVPLILGGGAVAAVSALALAGSAWMRVPYGQTGLMLRLLLIFTAVLGTGAMLLGVLLRIIWAVSQKQQAMLRDEFAIHHTDSPTEASKSSSAGRQLPAMRGNLPPRAAASPMHSALGTTH